MNEEIRKMGISVEEIINSIMGITEKEVFGYETDSIVMFNKKIALEHEIKLKLLDLVNFEWKQGTMATPGLDIKLKISIQITQVKTNRSYI